jgi:hypothetical protein
MPTSASEASARQNAQLKLPIVLFCALQVLGILDGEAGGGCPPQQIAADSDRLGIWPKTQTISLLRSHLLRGHRDLEHIRTRQAQW